MTAPVFIEDHQCVGSPCVHDALLMLVRRLTGNPTAAWLAKALGLRLGEAIGALNDLEIAGAVEGCYRGNWTTMPGTGGPQRRMRARRA